MTDIDTLRQPPHNVQAEQALLHAVLSGGNLDAVYLDPSEFYRREHQLIFEAMQALAAKRREVDIVTVGEYMAVNGTLEEIGGMPAFGEISDATPGARNIPAYAAIIRKHAKARELIQLGNRLQEAQADDWEEVADEVSVALLAKSQTETRWDCDMTAALREGVDAIERAYQSDGLVGVNTGFKRLNELFGGFHKNHLIVIGARPSMGKTALMLNHAIAADQPIGIVSAEMSRAELALRLISNRASVNSTKLANADLEESDWPKITAAAEWLRNRNVAIFDKPSPKIREVMQFARRAKRERNIGALYVDYIQELKASDPKAPMNLQVGEIAASLKQLARELQIPVIALAQVNREVEKRADKRPGMADLKHSGEIEQEADLVYFLYRDEVYNADTADQGVAEILIDKNRHGPTGFVKLVWQGEYMRFRDFAVQWAGNAYADKAGNA